MELYVTIEELKRQVSLVEEYSGDDAYLAHLIQVACSSVEHDIHQPISTFVTDDGGLEPMLKHAVLVIGAHYYQVREPIAFVQPHIIPFTYQHLLQPFKKYT